MSDVRKRSKRKENTRKNIKWEELEEGIKHVLDNAARLNSDGELLLRDKRYPSSRILTLLAQEEIGKAYLLADHWAGKRDISPPEYKQIFRSGGAHVRKLSASGRSFLRAEAWQTIGDLLAEHDQEAKERSMYVDYVQSTNFGYWVAPAKDEGEEMERFLRMGKDRESLRELTDRIDALDIAERVKRNSSAIASMRAFVDQQKGVLPSAPTPEQPVIVGPARRPPQIKVASEFTVEYLLRKYEECLSMLSRPDIGALPSWRPANLPSLSHPVPTLEKLQEDVAVIPSENGKKGFILYHLAGLRANLFSHIHERTQELGRLGVYEIAVQLMNEYATRVAIPFGGKESHARKAVRVAKSIGKAESRRPLPHYPDQWRTRYRGWIRNNKSLDRDKRFRAFLDLSQTFSMLYAMSFSSSNSPRLDELTQEELNRFLATGHFP